MPGSTIYPQKKRSNCFISTRYLKKILIQHEYLHQLDIEETLDYVEEIISEDAPELVVYHGSNIAFEKIDLKKSHDRRDFGRGFYCTVLESQAEEWAKRLYLRSHKGGRYVYRYLFQQTDALKIKHFSALDQNGWNLSKKTARKAASSTPMMW